MGSGIGNPLFFLPFFSYDGFPKSKLTKLSVLSPNSNFPHNFRKSSIVDVGHSLQVPLDAQTCKDVWHRHPFHTGFLITIEYIHLYCEQSLCKYCQILSKSPTSSTNITRFDQIFLWLETSTMQILPIILYRTRFISPKYHTYPSKYW